jgi:hypothetical protein
MIYILGVFVLKETLLVSLDYFLVPERKLKSREDPSWTLQSMHVYLKPEQTTSSYGRWKGTNIIGVFMFAPAVSPLFISIFTIIVRVRTRIGPAGGDPSAQSISCLPQPLMLCQFRSCSILPNKFKSYVCIDL